METNNNYVYVITTILSGYKEDLHDSDIKTYVFGEKDKARKRMKEIAKEMYEDSEIIQEADDRYFEIYKNNIYFGENSDCGTGYRAEWGLVKLEKVIMDN